MDEWEAEGKARSASAGKDPSTMPRVSLATLQAAYPGVDFDMLRETPPLTREEPERERAAEKEKGGAAGDAEGAAADSARPLLCPEEDKVDADAPARRSVRRRTPQALVAVRGDVPESLPAGPWATDTLALAALNGWAADHRTHGGGFGLVWTHGRYPGNGRRGDQHRMGCDQHRKQGCGFSIMVEETTDGWVVGAYAEHVETVGKLPVNGAGHSHALTASLGERLAHATQREIPEVLHADAQLMYKSGTTVKDVENWLRAKAREGGCDAAFTYHDVFRLVAASTTDRAWDATDFVEALQRRLAERGHAFHIHLSDEGRLERAIFLMDGALEIYAAGGTAPAVVFDTKVCAPDRPRPLRTPATLLCPRRCSSPQLACVCGACRHVSALIAESPAQPPHPLMPLAAQHGTNTHKLKLGCFVTVGPSGATRVLAASLVAAEDEASFAWVFQRFVEAFRRPPAVLYTDSDPAMAAAAARMLVNTLHLLCVWHLSKNAMSNIKPAAFPSLAAHSAFMDDWWKICLESDTSSVLTFDREWAALLLPLKATASSPSKTAALDWLESLYARRERWAARWTYRTLTYSMHSTQRGEAVHSALARFCSASMLLTDLVDRLDTYGDGVAVRGETKDALRCLRLLGRQSRGTVSPLLSSLGRLICPYAHSLVEAQEVQSSQYVVQSCGEGEFTVRRVDVSSHGTRPPLASVQEQAADAADGLGGTPSFARARTCSLAACSCQWPCSVGLPCRHQLAVARQLQLTDASQLRFAPHWQLMDDARRAELVRVLLATAPPPHPGGAVATRPVLLKADRFAMLQSDFRGISAAASEAPGLTEWLRVELARLASALRDASAEPGATRPLPRGTATEPRRTAGGRGGGGPARGAAAATLLQQQPPAARHAAPRGRGAAHAVDAGPEGKLPSGEGGRPRACRLCGLPGHRADNRSFHPDGAAGAAAAAAAAPTRKRIRRAPLEWSTSDEDEEGESSDAPSSSDDLPLGLRASAMPRLPAGPPPPIAGSAERRRGAVSGAAGPGGGGAPPILAPSNVRSKGRPKQARLKSAWEKRGGR